MPRAPNRAHRARTMKRRGQGAFEYILMLAGVLLIVILIVLILQANLANTNTGIRNSVNQYQLVSSSDMQKNEVVGLVATTAIMPLTWADNNTAVSGGLLNTVPCSFNYPAALAAPRCSAGTPAGWTLRPNCPGGYFNNKSGTC